MQQYTTVIFGQYLGKLDIVRRHRNRLYLTVHYAKRNLTILQDAKEYTEKKAEKICSLYRIHE